MLLGELREVPPMVTSTPGSLPAGERNPVLDMVRGFALMGILIMNMPGFGNSMFAEADGSFLWSGRVDRGAEALREMLFSGKFNSMFSMLFGIGFTVQFARMQRADPEHATAIYLRRLLVLAALGIVHAAVFWGGDVLHVYAILGIVLLFGLRHASDRTLLALMALCLLYPLVSGLLRLWVMTPELVASRVALAQGFERADNAIFGHGTFWQAAALHAREFAFFYSDPIAAWNFFGFYVQMALTMLLGLLAGRHRWPDRIPELMPTLRKVHVWALVVGISCGALFAIIFELNRTPGPSLIKLLGGVAYWASRLAMMIFYVLLIVRLAQHPAWARRFGPIAAAGRMPLTNYLMQTAICTTLFYGWGFGLWGRIGPAAQLMLALAIFFLIQVPWSVWWLARHDRGPLEALWSRLTYGRARPDLRKASA